MSGLTTHVLDLASGLPAAGVAVTLLRGEEVLASTVTNADGRTDRPLADRLEAGRLRAALRGRRPLRGRRRAAVPRRRAGPLRGQRPRARTSMCRCSSRPAATAPTVAADEVVARCRELARVSDEPGRLTRLFGGPGMERANALVGRWMEEAGMAVRVDAARNLVGRAAGLGPGRGHAPARLAPRHGARRRRVRRAARRALRDRLRRAAAGGGGHAAVRRRRARRSPTRRGCGSATAYLGSRAVAGTVDRRAARPRGRRRRHRARGARGDGRGDRPRARASGCSATARCTSSRGRCWRSAGCRSAWSARSRARPAPRSASRAGAGHAGTVPMALRHDAAPARWRNSCSRSRRSAARRRGCVATVGRLEALPGRAERRARARRAGDARRAARRRRTSATTRSPRSARAPRRSRRRAA